MDHARVRLAVDLNRLIFSAPH